MSCNSLSYAHIHFEYKDELCVCTWKADESLRTLADECECHPSALWIYLFLFCFEIRVRTFPKFLAWLMARACQLFIIYPLGPVEPLTWLMSGRPGRMKARWVGPTRLKLLPFPFRKDSSTVRKRRSIRSNVVQLKHSNLNDQNTNKLEIQFNSVKNSRPNCITHITVFSKETGTATILHLGNLLVSSHQSWPFLHPTIQLQSEIELVKQRMWFRVRHN